MELSDHVTSGEHDLATEALNDVVDAATKISQKSLMVEAEYTSAEAELLDKVKDLQEKQENCKKWEKIHTVSSAATGTGSAAVAIATPFAATTVAALNLGPVGVVVVTICPYTLAAGLVRSAVFGVVAYLNKQKAHDYGIKSASQKEMADTTSSIAQAADMNQNLWLGVGMAAKELKDNVDILSKLNQRRKTEVKRRTEALASPSPSLLKHLMSIWFG